MSRWTYIKRPGILEGNQDVHKRVGKDLKCTLQSKSPQTAYSKHEEVFQFGTALSRMVGP